MKHRTQSMLAALLGLSSFSAASHGAQAGQPASAPSLENLLEVYKEGRKAFNRGDLVTAKDAFTKVLRAKPDFDLAQIYMAQIRLAEAKWEARPRSLKIAGISSVAQVSFKGVSLADALEVVRREVEKSGKGVLAGPIELILQVPASDLERPVDLSVRDIRMTDFVSAVAFAGGVEISWHERGLMVRPGGAPEATPDPHAAAETRKVREAAAKWILPEVRFEGARVQDALQWLAGQPGAENLVVVAREPVSDIPLQFQLRHVPAPELLSTVALVSGMELTWHPWGAGLAPRNSLAIQQ